MRFVHQTDRGSRVEGYMTSLRDRCCMKKENEEGDHRGRYLSRDLGVVFLVFQGRYQGYVVRIREFPLW